MNYNPMLTFLSEGSIKSHIEYLRGERLRHSIEEKSFPEIKGKSPKEISSMNIKKSIKSEILPRLVNIKLHENYFSSFSSTPTTCKPIKKFYSSEDAFLYEILNIAKGAEYGFLYITADERRTPRIRLSVESDRVFVREFPILSLDLCEHAYFPDYSFDRDKYLRAALAHLDLSKLKTALDTTK